MSPKDTIKIIILSKSQAKNLIDSGKYKKEQLDEAMKESMNSLLNKKEKGVGWGDLSLESDMIHRDLNKMASIILVQQEIKSKAN